ncbi:MAG: DAK2 domain-containing protein [Actinomycetota bacterium]|nr:DAK2 domain-containing protein [Actinomycetota bacterium]
MVQRGRLLAGLLMRYAEILGEFREKIDRLNVYPVPDGDTGTNMFFTLRSATEVIESRGLASGANRGNSSDFMDAGKAALLGARGNSGVILSQVIGSLCKVVGEEPGEDADLGILATALARADERARAAVLNPVEGTILTVISEVAVAAKELAAAGARLVEAAPALLDAAEASLSRTPELLAQLRKAGVVDSGGAGFVLMVAALCDVAGAEGFGEGVRRRFGFESVVPESAARVETVSAVQAEGLGPRYEVMFLLESNDAQVLGFREVWAGLGDSIVVVGQDGTYNCHIHTDDIGASIEAGVEAGRPSRIRVTDLYDQVSEEQWVIAAGGAGAPDPYGPESAEPVETAVVVIANGDGIARIFRSLGVQRIVLGGQSMNPSTEEILAAIEEVPAPSVIVLPNNTNVTPVAQVAASLSPKEVAVIPTSGVVEGMSALVEYDPMNDIASNVQVMRASAKRVVVAEVTQAVRDYRSEIGEVAAGDFIGLGAAGVVAIAKTAARAAIDSIGALISQDAEIITLIEGEGASGASSREVTEWLAAEHPELEVEVLHGAQPLYPYLIGIE